MEGPSRSHQNWQNIEIMKFMFTDMSENREQNELSYDDKMSFWIEQITEYCEQNNLIIIDRLHLERAFVLNSQTPQCFVKILNYMHRDKMLELVNDYSFKDSNDSWMKWSMDTFIKKPATWGFRSFVSEPIKSGVNYVLNHPEEKRDNDIPYVYIKNLKKLAKIMLEEHKNDENINKSNKIFTLDELEKRHMSNFKSDTEFHVAIMYLCLIKACSISQNENMIKVVKFLESPKYIFITQEDFSLLSNKIQIDKLEKNIITMQKDQNKCLKSAKSIVSENRMMALSYLRRKKYLDKKIMDTLSLIENLFSLIEKLDDADHTKSTVEAFSNASKVFVKTMKSSSSVDQIYSTMEEINEVMEANKEIQDAIGLPVDGELDETQLMMELENIMLNDTTQIEVSTIPAKQPSQFPDVPCEVPSMKSIVPNEPLVSLNCDL